MVGQGPGPNVRAKSSGIRQSVATAERLHTPCSVKQPPQAGPAWPSSCTYYEAKLPPTQAKITSCVQLRKEEHLGISLRDTLRGTSFPCRCWPTSSQKVIPSPTLALARAQYFTCWWLLPSCSFLAKCAWMCAVFSRAGGMSGLQRGRR